MLSWLSGLKKTFQDNFLAKITTVFLSGTLGHKVTLVIGILAVVAGIWKAFIPLLISIAGLIIIQIAIKDYERLKDREARP